MSIEQQELQQGCETKDALQDAAYLKEIIDAFDEDRADEFVDIPRQIANNQHEGAVDVQAIEAPINTGTELSMKNAGDAAERDAARIAPGLEALMPGQNIDTSRVRMDKPVQVAQKSPEGADKVGRDQQKLMGVVSDQVESTQQGGTEVRDIGAAAI